MKKIRPLIFIGLIVCLSFSDKKINLVGLWQDSPEVAAGWTNIFQIFPDGNFKFTYNSMVCDKRNISYSGKWKKDSSGNLVLMIWQKEILEGGKLIPSDAFSSCASDSTIDGGVNKTINLEKPEKKVLKLSGYRTDPDHYDIETMKIDNVRYWKIRQDPKD